jgi:hypothetical protein
MLKYWFYGSLKYYRTIVIEDICLIKEKYNLQARDWGLKLSATTQWKIIQASHLQRGFLLKQKLTLKILKMIIPAVKAEAIIIKSNCLTSLPGTRKFVTGYSHTELM